MRNRLIESSSPYLLQHKDNPIHWQPWDDEALSHARTFDRPIFLSVGYSSCHWCHVMAHESFEDDGIAQFVNENFVCIKVDREERPDLDEIYMLAVQLSSGRGGWPMTVFLTPNGDPFFAGTYFPKEGRGGHPGFLDLCQQIARLWTEGRVEIDRAAEEFATSMRRVLDRRLVVDPDVTFDGDLLDHLVMELHGDFDHEWGGFGDAPKFPPHSALKFLALYAASDRVYKHLAIEMLDVTLQKMCIGGVHDQLGGGIHRYSTDTEWKLPHFEKMISDNGLFAEVLGLSEPLVTAETQREIDRASQGLVRWVREEMTSPEGLFYTALDADSEGEEGTFYTWPIQEFMEFEGGEGLAATFQFTEKGNFEEEHSHRPNGRNILHRGEPHLDPFAGQQATILEARNRRVRPFLDDKCLAGINGLMITGLFALDEKPMAQRALQIWKEATGKHGMLPRQIIGGEAHGLGFLEDYAFMAQAALAVGDTEWALALADQAIVLFLDEDAVGLYCTSLQHETLLGRPRSVLDQSVPSPAAVLASVLASVGRETVADRLLSGASSWMKQVPTATESWHQVVLLHKLTSRQVLEIVKVKHEDSRLRVVFSLAPDHHLNPELGREAIRLQCGGFRYHPTEVSDGEALFELGTHRDSQTFRLDYQVCNATACLAWASIPIELNR
jgi:hypothetical protein